MVIQSKSQVQEIKDEHPNHKGNCGPIAISIACRIPYNEALRLAYRFGYSIYGGGMNEFRIIAAVQKHMNTTGLGADRLTELAGNRKHLTVDRFSQYRLPGTYLVFLNDHVLVVRHGAVIDWTREMSRRIKNIYKVTEK